MIQKQGSRYRHTPKCFGHTPPWFDMDTPWSTPRKFPTNDKKLHTASFSYSSQCPAKFLLLVHLNYIRYRWSSYPPYLAKLSAPLKSVLSPCRHLQPYKVMLLYLNAPNTLRSRANVSFKPHTSNAIRAGYTMTMESKTKIANGKDPLGGQTVHFRSQFGHETMAITIGRR
jgi:hypothetical protein